MEGEKESCGEKLYISITGGLPYSAALPFFRLPIYNSLDINNKSEPVSDWIKVRIILFGGDNRTRTCDPIDVNDVLSAAATVVRGAHECAYP